MSTYYFSNNAAGADPSFPTSMLGNNGLYNGLSRYPGFLDDGVTANSAYGPLQTPNGFSFPSGSHIFKFAKGGAWASLTSISPSSGTSKTARKQFTSYDVPGFTSSSMPILVFTTDGFNFNKSSFHEVDHLDIRGSAAANSKGAVLANASYLDVHDNRISGFVIGAHGSDGDNSSPTTDYRLYNNEIDHNVDLGFEGGGNRFLIEGNNIHHNGQNIAADHNIYLASNGVDYDNIIVRGNTLTFNTQNVASSSNAVALVAHGTIKNLLIEDNVIIDLSADYQHYGIAVNGVTAGTTNPQHFPGLIIRGNLIVVGQHGTLGINWDRAPYAIVENNCIIHIAGTDEYFTGISWDDSAHNPSRGDIQGHHNIVRNNSIFIDFANSAPPTSFTVGINAGTFGLGNDTIVNNVVYMRNAGTGAMYAMKLNGRALSTFLAISNNLYYSPNTTITVNDLHSTIAAAQGYSTPYEQNSAVADPTFITNAATLTTNYSLAVQSGSPAIDTGGASTSSRTAYGRFLRGGSPDKGAPEFNASTVLPHGVSSGSGT